MSRRVLLVAALAALAAPQAGLAKKPQMGFSASYPEAPPTQPTAGAIFNVSAGYAPLIEGTRAHGVGDVLTVVLAESTSTTKTAATKTQRSGNASITPPTAGPLAINPNALNGSSQSTFNGQGNTTQTNALSGTITVTVAQVRSNGTLLVRGQKLMTFSQGDEWIQFSGIVRPADIDPVANTIQSSQVADARIEYSGNGSIQRSAREGWLLNLFNKISPF